MSEHCNLESSDEIVAEADNPGFQVTGPVVPPQDAIPEPQPRKKMFISAVAKEVYRHYFGDRADNWVGNFTSNIAKNKCSEMSFLLHNALAYVVRNGDCDLYCDDDVVCSMFEVVCVNSGLRDEHTWVMFNNRKYSVDLSIEQYRKNEVTDTSNKPWCLFSDTRGCPLKSVKFGEIECVSQHVLFFKNPCVLPDDANIGMFMSFWKGLDEASREGFCFEDKDAIKYNIAEKRKKTFKRKRSVITIQPDTCQSIKDALKQIVRIVKN